eukprot:g14946.t1
MASDARSTVTCPSWCGASSRHAGAVSTRPRPSTRCAGVGRTAGPAPLFLLWRVDVNHGNQPKSAPKTGPLRANVERRTTEEPPTLPCVVTS